MADGKGTIDLDSLSDDEVKALSGEDIERLSNHPAEPEPQSEEEPENEPGDTDDQDSQDDADDDSDSDDENENDDEADNEEDNEDGKEEEGEDDDDASDDGSDDDAKSTKDSESDDDEEAAQKSKDDGDSKGGKKKPADETDPADEVKDPASADGGDKKKSAKKGDQKDAKVDPDASASGSADASTMADFYNKITAPFKANGKDVQVRTPEEAIRLMQMGTNYSKRMQELKPLRAMNAMLQQHGLTSEEDVSFLIDLKNGDEKAIKKLLKDQKIDPLDIDMDEADGYQPKNYAPDPQSMSFREAIEETYQKEGGQELIQDINDAKGYWDDASKEALRKNPGIFDNLLEQRSSGIYEKITAELDHQLTMGYLKGVPFLEAYDAVGVEMEKAGAFGSAKQTETAETKKDVATPQGKKPVGTGSRKAKASKPNPVVSSTKQPRTTKNTKREETPDFSTMSDEDFLKLEAPA